MNRFSLPSPTTVTVEHLNVRDEQHGDDKVLAIDVKLSMECGNDVLALFHPLLKAAHYCNASRAPADPQPRLELDDPVDLPDLRWPHLEPLKWSEDLEGRTLTLDYGLAGKSAIKLTDCVVNSFRMELKDGGRVVLTWRVQRSQPDERTLAKIASLLKRQVQATLTASPEAQALLDENDGDDDGSGAWPFPESVGAVNGKPIDKPAARKPKDATEAFVEIHGGKRAKRASAEPAP